jgi:hypothetical protein
MLDTGKARQNADPGQANNPNEPTYIPQMFIRKYGDPQSLCILQWEYTTMFLKL